MICVKVVDHKKSCHWTLHVKVMDCKVAALDFTIHTTVLNHKIPALDFMMCAKVMIHCVHKLHLYNPQQSQGS